MSTLTTLILIASGIIFDTKTGSELMVTTKNCLVRSGADLSYYEIAVLPKGAVVRTFPKENYGQFAAIKLGGEELGTFENITCDIELINTTTEDFDREGMTYTARKGDKAALRQIGVEAGNSVSRYKGASLTSGQVYSVLGVSMENERAIQRTILEIAMPESSFAFVLNSDLAEAPVGAEQRSNNPIFQAQVSEKTILEYRKKEEERRQAQIMEEKKLAEQKAQQEREEEKRRKVMEEERRAAEELEIKEQEDLDRQKELLQIENESRQSEDQTDGQAEGEIDAADEAPTVEEKIDEPPAEVEPTEEINVLSAATVPLPDAFSVLESSWKSMVNGPVLEAEPTPLRREFESLANQNENEIIASQAKRLLEAIDLFVLIQNQEQKFVELKSRLGQLESDVATRQKLVLSRTDLDFVGILSTSKAYDGKPGANGRPRPLLLRLRDPVSQRTLVYLNPKGPLSEQLWQLSRNQAIVGVSGTRAAKLLGVPRLQTVGTLEVLGAQ